MPRVLTGVVVSDKGDKTIVISVATRKKHPLYRKRYTVNTRFMAHDEANSAKVGDKVAILECRPISARKRFMLNKIIEKAHAGFVEADATADVPVDQKTEDTKQKTAEKETEERKTPTSRQRTEKKLRSSKKKKTSEEEE